ncbi:ATP-binding protein [Pseudomonas citrulli]|uniref:ATP-binding protein n=1 Tax=Pseudomonas citrulli TaxID=3064347 RepID=A0ABT9BVP1_9PSED|nr:ATP-binding protein [Pseudomonas sp. K18]MDO7896613.1 ATP-binding protein [Pseudomonas sp. K18]
MRSINILSLTQASISLAVESFSEFLKFHGIAIKKAEIEDLKALVKVLYAATDNIGIFDTFYVGYKISQIGKEFDLLRFGTKDIINIELKKTCTEIKIKNQLHRNKYYLNYLKRQVYSFTFVSDVETLYFIASDGSLEEIEPSFLTGLLTSQTIDRTEVIDNLFTPSDYLVSPFNSTHKFLNGEYFLTHQQEDIKNQIIQSLDLARAATFTSVTGSAGTGKTLLIYDIAKELMANKKKSLIIHCGQLNDGQIELNNHGWKIIPINNYANIELSTYSLIIIDEAQRIYPKQLKDITDKIIAFGGKCIFSYDKVQTLASWEEARNIDKQINSIQAISTYKLSEKIRTNKEIAAVIKMLFNNKRQLNLSSIFNIELNYFKNLDDAKNYLGTLSEAQWEIIKFTPSQYNNEHHEKYSESAKKTSHQVIGQEFDNVAVMIDQYFSYNAGGDLVYRGRAYYDPTKMLFQNITRTRKKLNLVILDNEELLNRCVSILQ